MVVQFPCLKCNRAVAKNHKAVQCDICDKWIHIEIYNLISDMKIKLKIIGISESRLQKSKQHTTNISLPNYVYEHTPTESSKEGTLLYLDKNLKYKLRKDLNIYQKGMIVSTFVEIINKNEKNMVSGCIYKHPKQTIPDFLDNHLLPLLLTHPLE